MNTKIDEVQITLSTEYYIPSLAETFFRAKSVEGLSPHTLRFYKIQLKGFLDWLNSQQVHQLEQLNPGIIRSYLSFRQEQGRKASTVNASYRPIRAFLNFTFQEYEPTLPNPILKCKPPRVPKILQAPAELEDISRMLAACNRKKIAGLRDYALILTLLDSCARISEVLDLRLEDFRNDDLFIQAGKGNKTRIGFISQKTRIALRRYIRARKDSCPYIFVSQRKGRLSYSGVIHEFKFLAAKVGLAEAPTPHGLRRAGALSLLRSGANLLVVSKILGHTSIETTTVYLRLDADDLREQHGRFAPADRL